MAELDSKIPEIGLRFRNPDECWLFWVAYGGRTGFDVRKRCTNVSKMDECWQAFLSPMKGKEEDEGEEKDKGEEEDEGEEESHILSDFSACMFGHEDETSFEEEFQIMRSKVHKQTWLDSIYKHFERLVQEKRDKELESEFEARKKLPRRLMCTPMLVQANQVYTPVIFEAFQSEYEKSMVVCVRVWMENTNMLMLLGICLLEEKLNLISAGGTNEPCEDKENVDPNAQQRDDLLSDAQLKKEVQSNYSRRTRTWIDKLRKGKRKNPKCTIPTKKGSKGISYASYSSMYVVAKNCLTN
ncbi:hypothetical protein OsJ_06648 [Oryza sativa Japonica Group]|uniref:Uncharacterized protein n=1 Tax=Oryza sativa subsp. japonica TaxID=39947 RepID=B9EZV3_ORYSJ|nr:hypothetical protein OsJ_06648 [Oryza sativa Japonica Group]